MRKTLIATAIVLGLGLTLPAFAADNENTSKGSSTLTNTDSSTHTRTDTDTNTYSTYATGADGSAASSGGTADSFNVSKAVANSTLNGSVSDVAVWGIGNSAVNKGDANGGRGSSGGKGGSGGGQTRSARDPGYAARPDPRETSPPPPCPSTMEAGEGVGTSYPTLTRACAR